MTYIIEFSVSGLAGNKGTYSHRLNRDINIFFGLNGSGKTSLLKILHSALNSNTEILKDVPFEAATVKIFSEDYKKEFVYSIRQKGVIQDNKTIPAVDQSSIADSTIGYVAEISQEPSSPSNIKWDIKPKPSPSFNMKWAHRYLPTSRLYLGVSASSYQLTLTRFALNDTKDIEDPFDVLFSSYLQGLWSQYSARILRTVREAQEDGLANIFKSILSKERIKETELEVDPETAYNRVSAFLERQGSLNSLGSFTYFKERYESDPSFRNIVSDINDVENRIAQATDRRNKLESSLQKMFSENKKISFQDNSVIIETRQNTKINLNALSSGEKQLLMILISTVMAERSSILIDEPELSMHIDWQRQLINIMRELNPSAQLILATHSPEVMADISDDRIFSL